MKAESVRHDGHGMQAAFALLAGSLFGVGLAVSGMVNPTKVVGFLDFAGAWDPTLAFVMFGALAVTAPAFRMLLRDRKPWFAASFVLPARRDLDVRLILGSIIFGAGWGLAGWCPGPAIADLVSGRIDVAAFVAAMVCAMVLFQWLDRSSDVVPSIKEQRAE